MFNTVKKKKLLLIDDDEIHLEIAMHMLNEDYETISASSGQNALELFYKGHVPHLVLLDIVMPNMDGWEVYRRIKAISTLHDIPVAFYTSLTGEEEKKHAKAIGAADYLIKPFKRDELLERLETILAVNEKA